jgi:hypothetical protein
METAQALAIAAAAFVTALVIDAPAFPQHVAARTEMAITNAVDRAVWRTNIEPAIVLDEAGFVAPRAVHWSSCAQAPKHARL